MLTEFQNVNDYQTSLFVGENVILTAWELVNFWLGSGMGHLYITGQVPEWIFKLPNLRTA